VFPSLSLADQRGDRHCPERIVEEEEVAYDDDGLEFVAGYANGNLRQGILAAQTTVENAGNSR